MNKGLWIWQLAVWDKDTQRANEISTPEKLVALLKRGKFGHVLVKVTDGTLKFNKFAPDYADIYIKAFRQAGIDVWGWGYVYGTYPTGEAAVAIERCKELGLTQYVIDAEEEYKYKPSQAATYMAALRKGLPNAKLALSTYRFPEYHREFPFKEFMQGCDLVMPQVYWEDAHNPASQLAQCISEYKALGFNLPLVPAGAAYKSTSVVWQPTAGEVKEFYQAAVDSGLTACNFWEWQCAERLGLMEVLVGLKNANTEPVVEPVDEPDTNPDYYNQDEIRAIVREEMKVLVDALTVTLSQWARG